MIFLSDPRLKRFERFTGFLYQNLFNPLHLFNLGSDKKFPIKN